MKAKLVNRKVDIDLKWHCQKNESIYGISKASTLEVKINNSLATDEKKKTLIHELIHMMDNGNVAIKNLSELQTEQLTTELLFFIQNNKQIIKWLMK